MFKKKRNSAVTFQFFGGNFKNEEKISLTTLSIHPQQR